MRKVLCETLIQYSNESEFVFLTGDLGFMALEPLKKSLGQRFINAGIAEQNMVSVAAGMASIGLKPWVYSIGPFVYARPFEQIRNDICMHDLPVAIIGNGGGYAYGAMGATHHALEDYGALLCPNIRIFVPDFSSDVAEIIHKLFKLKQPAYLRLGRSEEPKNLDLPPYAPWRRLMTGGGPTMLVIGPLAGGLMKALSKNEEQHKPNLWVLTELPFKIKTIPEEFINDLHHTGHLFLVEEHVAHGSVGHMLCHCLLAMGKAPTRFTHRHALGYVSGLYGSQAFHRKECGLDPESIRAELEETGKWI